MLYLALVSRVLKRATTTSSKISSTLSKIRANYQFVLGSASPARRQAKTMCDLGADGAITGSKIIEIIRDNKPQDRNAILSKISRGDGGSCHQ